MKDRKGRVIYVGKAKDLRARVKQYFRPGGDEREFVATGLLGRLLADVDTIVVFNEKEALLLENNLIKQHQPRFNVKLTDDKNYLVLRIDPTAYFPRVEVTRGIKDDGARYFGPYHSATSARETLRLVNRHFQLRTCTDHVLENRKRPCIQYQIKRCPAPCVFPIDAAEYGLQVDDVSLFLGGKKDELLPRLKGRMKELAGKQAYEHAAMVRDQIVAVEKVLTKQNVVSSDFVDQDVIGFHRKDDVVEFAVLFMRQGKLLGRRTFQFKDQEFPDEDVVRTFVQQYYDQGTFVPDEVVLPIGIDNALVVEDWLRGLRGGGGARVDVFSPQRGPRMQLLELARRNAEASMASRKSNGEDALAALEKPQKRLSLKRLPRRIECFDIAHVQGSATVASMVVFLDGEPAKSEYRKFKVKSVTNDDFAAMYEVLSRRFRRAKAFDPVAGDDDELRKGWGEPDLLVVDGGKGQLSTALAALRDLQLDARGEDAPSAEGGNASGRGADSMDVISLAKEREDQAGTLEPDRVFLRDVKDPLRLRPSSTELFLLARIRDEAHRFANKFHRELRKSRTLRSALEDVPGVGAKRKRLLLRHLGSLKRIKAASVEELAAVPGMSRKAAEAVKRWFGPGPGAPQPPPPGQENDREKDP